MPFDFASAAISAIPSAGALGAAAIQRNWALKDWHRVNEYNKPINQVARNKEAGLPLAAMFDTGGSQASNIDTTNVDPTLGTAKGIEAFSTNRMLRKQLQLMDEQIGKAEADKIISQVAANKAREEDRFYQAPKIDSDGFLIEGNKRQDSLALSMREQEAKTKTAEIMADLSRAKTQADIDHVLSTIGLSQQQLEHNKIMQKIDHWISNRLDNKGISALEAIFYKLFLHKTK